MVLALASVFIFGVPALNNAVEGENPFKAGEPYVVVDSYQITPEPGWELETNDLFVTLKKSGGSYLLTPAVAADEPLEEAIQPSIDGLANDPSNTWAIGEPVTFVTNAGDHGIKVVSHSATQASETWIISNGESSITIAGFTPESAWTVLSPEMEAMAASIAFLNEGGEG